MDASNYRQIPLGVVVPRTRDDVIMAVSVCRKHGAPIVSRAGGTAMAGQTVNEAVVLDFSKSGCCGVAGSFGFESGEKYDVSVAEGERVLLPAVCNAEAATLVVADGSPARRKSRKERRARGYISPRCLTSRYARAPGGLSRRSTASSRLTGDPFASRSCEPAPASPPWRWCWRWVRDGSGGDAARLDRGR